MSSRDESKRVLDIIENIEAVFEYTKAVDLDAFRANRLLVDGCERCLLRITEAAIKIGQERFEQIAPNIRFVELRGMGNMLRHGYDQISDGVIYATIRNDLPALLNHCRHHLETAGSPTQ